MSAPVGFYQLHRGWQDHPVFRAEVFSRRDAFVWMIEQAAYTERRVATPQGPVTIRRGQFTHSVRYMAAAWKWDAAKVARFLKALCNDDMIVVETATGSATGQSLITLCNYDKYQAPQDRPDTAGDTATTQQRHSGDTNKNKGIREEDLSPSERGRDARVEDSGRADGSGRVDPVEVEKAPPAPAADPKPDGVDRLDDRDLHDLLEAVQDAAGYRPINPQAISRSLDTVKQWRADGISFDAIVIPTIRAMVADATEPTRTLGRFRERINHEHAKAKARGDSGKTYTAPAVPVLVVDGEDPRFEHVRATLLRVMGPVLYVQAVNPVRFAAVDDDGGDHVPVRVTDPRPPAMQVMNGPQATALRQAVREHGFSDVW